MSFIWPDEKHDSGIWSIHIWIPLSKVQAKETRGSRTLVKKSNYLHTAIKIRTELKAK